jgi:hypothetical protein
MPGSLALGVKLEEVAAGLSAAQAQYALGVDAGTFTINEAQRLAQRCEALTQQMKETAAMLEDEVSSSIFACTKSQQEVLQDLERQNEMQRCHLVDNYRQERALVLEQCAAQQSLSNFWWASFVRVRVPEQYILEEKYRVFDLVYPPFSDTESNWSAVSSRRPSSEHETASDVGSDEVLDFDNIQQSHLSPMQAQMFQDDGAFFDKMLQARETDIKEQEAEQKKQQAAKDKLNLLAAGKNTLHLKPFIQALSDETISIRYVQAKVAHAVKATVFPRTKRLKKQTVAAILIQCLARCFLARRVLCSRKLHMKYAAKVHHAARVLQGMYRMVWRARVRSYDLLNQRYKKYLYPELELFYYYNSVTKKAVLDRTAFMKRLNFDPERAFGEPEFLPALEEL